MTTASTLLCVPSIADDAYMMDEQQCKAYVEEDVGVIWRGTELRKVPLLWEYGQVITSLLMMTSNSAFFIL